MIWALEIATFEEYWGGSSFSSFFSLFLLLFSPFFPFFKKKKKKKKQEQQGDNQIFSSVHNYPSLQCGGLASEVA